MEGVGEVAGKQKKEIAAVVEQRNLDYELLERWIKYMAKPTDKYKNKDAWQAMMKKGGTPGRGQKACREFQDEVVRGDAPEERASTLENKVIADKDIEGTKPKKRTDKPSNFVSNKDFNPGALIQFKSLPDEAEQLLDGDFPARAERRRRSQRHDGGRCAQGNPGVLLFRGWGSRTAIGPETQARLKILQSRCRRGA